MLPRLFSRFVRPPPIAERRALAEFIDANSAFVAQSALYGYVKTRAGFDYFRLFEDETFVRSINIAKWNIYAACVGDLSLFCGAHIFRRLSGGGAAAETATLMNECIAQVFGERDTPPDAGDDYSALVRTARTRIAEARWQTLQDNETLFSRSPDALVYWAPIADRHKRYDAQIVRNSVIFKWKEVRDKFRRRIDVAALHREMRAKVDDV